MAAAGATQADVGVLLGLDVDVGAMLDEKLEVVVVEEPRLTRLHHGFKSLGQRDNLLLSLMWTSFFVHA